MSQRTWLIERIRHEYETLPGLKLTEAQACRLWSASADACRAAFEALVEEGLLWRAPSGRYVVLPRPRPAAVDLELVARCPHCGKRQSVPLTSHRVATALPLTIRCIGCQRVVHIAGIPA